MENRWKMKWKALKVVMIVRLRGSLQASYPGVDLSKPAAKRGNDMRLRG